MGDVLNRRPPATAPATQEPWLPALTPQALPGCLYSTESLAFTHTTPEPTSCVVSIVTSTTGALSVGRASSHCQRRKNRRRTATGTISRATSTQPSCPPTISTTANTKKRECMRSAGRSTSELTAAAAPKVAPRSLSRFQSIATTSMYNQFLLLLLVISSTCCLVIDCWFHTGVSYSVLLYITFWVILFQIILIQRFGCHFTHIHTNWDLFIQTEYIGQRIHTVWVLFFFHTKEEKSFAESVW